MRFTKTKAIVKALISVCALGFLSLSSFAAIESYEFSNDVQRERYQHFIEDMRCPKCQNQNLANSDAPISADLRRVIYEQIKAGRSDSEITEFMVSRYGDFILYNPRINTKTSALWLTPVVILVIGIIVIFMVLRHRRKLSANSNQLTSSEQTQLTEILETNPATESSSQRNEPILESVDSEVPSAKVAAKKAVTKKTTAKPVTSKATIEKTVTSKKSATASKSAEAKKVVKPKVESAKAKTETAKAKSPAVKSSTKKAEPAAKVAKTPAKTAKPAAKATVVKSTAKTTKPKTTAKKS